jgi:hypothetical protein
MINLEVPIELLAEGRSALVGSTSDLLSTQTVVNTADYNGTVTYYFEAVYTNTDTSNRTIELLDAAGTQKATITAVASTSAPTRARSASFTPNSGSDTYRIRLPSLGAGLMQVKAARIIIVQVNATKTRIQIPLTTSGATAGESGVALDVTTGTTYTQTQVSKFSMWKRDDSAWKSYITTNPFTLESVISNSSTKATTSVGLFNVTDNSLVAETTTTSVTTVVVSTEISASASNFLDLKEYEARFKNSSSKSGQANILKASLYIRLENISDLEIYLQFLQGKFVSSGSSTIEPAYRYLYTASNFSNISGTYHEVVGYEASSGTIENYLVSHSTNDSGTSSTSQISGSNIDFPSATKVVIRSSAVTLTDGHRYIAEALRTSGAENWVTGRIVVKIAKYKYFWISGAEAGGTSSTDNKEFAITVGAPAITSSVKRTGAYSYNTNGSSVAFTEIGSAFNTSIIYARTYFRFSAAPGAVNIFYQTSTTGSVAAVTVRMNTNRTLELLYDNNAGTRVSIGTTTNALSTDSWYRIEVYTKTHGSSQGEATLRLYDTNDSTLLDTVSGTGLSIRNGDLLIGSLFGPRNSSQDIYFDDIVESPTTWAGKGQVIARQPVTGTPTYDAWNKTGADPYWDDTPFNTSKSATSTGTPSAQTKLIEDFDVTQTGHGTETIGASDTVNAALVHYVAKRGAGSPGDVYRLRNRISGNDYEPSVTLTTSDSGYNSFPFNPITRTQLNGMESGGNKLSGTIEMTIEDLWVMVDYTTSGVATFTKTHTTDSNKRKVATKTHTTDSLKRTVTTKTHTTDSFKRNVFTLTHTTDALKRKVTIQTHTTDSFLRGVNALTHTTDSNKKKETSVYHTTDSLKHITVTLTHTTDALKRAVFIPYHTTDALKRQVFTAIHTTDSSLSTTTKRFYWISGAESASTIEIAILGGTVTADPTIKRSGTHSWKTNGLNSYFEESGTKYNISEMYSRLYFYATALPTNPNIFYQTEAEDTGAAATVRLLANGKLELLYDNSGGSSRTSAGTTSGSITAGNWYRVEVYTKIGTTTGAVTLRVYDTDDSTSLGEVSASGVDVRGSALTMRGGLFGPRNEAAIYYFDDVIQRDDAWSGRGQVIARQPVTGTPTYDSWNKTGDDPYWDQKPYDTSNYATSTGANSAQTKLIGDFDVTQSGQGTEVIESTDTINQGAVFVVAKKSVGAPRTHKIRHRINSVDTDIQVTLSTSDTDSLDAVQFKEMTFPVTLTTLNSMEAGGIKVGSTGGEEMTIEDLYVFVDYTPVAFTRTHTTDSLKRTANTKIHSTDSLLKKGFTSAHTTDTLLRKEFSSTHTTDSLKRKAFEADHSTDSNKRKADVVVHTTDANKRKAFIVEHTTDTLLRKEFVKTHSTDSLKLKESTVNHTTDALKRKENTLSHTTDALKRTETAVSHSTDSLRKKETVVVHTTDSLKRKAFEVAHSTDSNKLKGFVREHTTDVNKRKAYTVEHFTDSLLREEDTRIHTTDSNKRKESTVTHSTDSNKRKAFVVEHSTDSLKRKAFSVEHTTDSFIEEFNVGRIWSSGFELNSTTSGVEWDVASSGTSIVTTPVRSGTYAGRANPASQTSFFYKELYAHVATGLAYYRFYLRVATAPGTITEIFSVADEADNDILVIKLNSDKTLELWDLANNVQLGSDSSALLTDTWYRIEVSLNTTPNDSCVGIARIEGSQFASGTFDASGVLDGDVAYLYLGAGIRTNTTADLYFDDIAINTNDWPEEGSIIHLRLNGDGDNNDWSGDYFDINEVTPNDAGDYTTAKLINYTSDYLLDDTPVDIANDTTINLVHIGVRYSGQAATNNSGFVLRAKKESAGTVAESQEITPANTTWVTNANNVPRNYPKTLYKDPDNNVWTKDTLDTSQIGTRISTANTNDAQVTTLWMVVDYTPTAAFTVSHTTDSLKRKENIKEHTTDALLAGAATRIHTTDTLLRKVSTIIHTTDSVLRTENTVEHTTDSLNRKVSVINHTTDANKRKVFEIVHTTDSLKRKETTKEHTTDSLLYEEKILTHNTDSSLRKETAVSHTTDSNKRKAYVLLHTTDALIRKAFVSEHSTDTLKRTVNTKSHTTDSLLRSENIKVHTTDSLKKKAFIVEHTTDANKQRVYTVDHTTDANKQKAYDISHSTDTNKRKETLVYHTTDALKRVAFSKIHTTDSVKRESFTVEHTTDSYIQKEYFGEWSDTWYWTTITFFTKDHTTDSLKRKETTATHSTDANKRLENTVYHITDSNRRKAYEVTHNTDALLRTEFTSIHTTDSLKRSENTKSHTTDALLRKEFALTHNTDALLRTETALEHTTDSLKRKISVVVHTTDSNKRKEFESTHLTDALKRKETVQDHTTDALLRKENELTHTTDSLKRSENTESHSTDSLLREENTVVHTTDSNKRKVYTAVHTTDALLRKEFTSEHTTDALKRTENIRSHSTDALLRTEDTKVHTTDTLKRKAFIVEHSTDSNKRRAYEVYHTTDANKRKEFSANHTTDALLREEFVRTHTTDAFKRTETALTHSTDTNKRKVSVVTHLTDAFLRGANTATHTTDSNKRKVSVIIHFTDSLKRKEFEVSHTTDIFRRTEYVISHSTDSNKIKAYASTHSTDALLRTVTTIEHSTDALKRKEFSRDHSTDSLLRKEFTSEHTTDANKRKVNVVQHTTNSYLRGANTVIHSTDSLKRKEFTAVHTTDSLKRKVFEATHTTDSFRRTEYVAIHTTDSNKRKAFETDHLTDALLRKESTAIHTTDINKRKAFEAYQTTDALLRKVFPTEHTTDALKRLIQSVEHSTDTLKKTENILTHLTDALKRKLFTQEHTTDALLRKEFTSTHTTDSNLRTFGEFTDSHSTDALLKTKVSSTHTTDTFLHQQLEATLSHTTDTSTHVRVSLNHTTDTSKVSANVVSHTIDALKRKQLLVSHSTDILRHLEFSIDHSTDAFLRILVTQNVTAKARLQTLRVIEIVDRSQYTEVKEVITPHVRVKEIFTPQIIAKEVVVPKVRVKENIPDRVEVIEIPSIIEPIKKWVNAKGHIRSQ